MYYVFKNTGIGRELTIKLAKLSAKVIAISQTQSKLDSLKDELKEYEVTTVQVNLANWDETCQKLGKICEDVDFLVNNAGYAQGLVPIIDQTEEELDHTLAVNLKAPINLIRLVGPGMKERRFGSIVNISSVAGIAALDGHLAYASSKAALDMVTKISAKELGPFNVRVNSINPTVVWTDMGRLGWSEPAKKEAMISKIPLGRFVGVDEVVGPIIFLLSDQSAMINGVMLPIDGGFVAT